VENDSHFQWTEARYEHRGALQKFVCAEPPKAKYEAQRGMVHRAPWQIEVQGHLRGLVTPLTDSVVLLAMDNDVVAAACHYGLDDDHDQFIIFALAPSVDYANQGLGAELLARVLKDIQERRQNDERDCGVFTRTWPKNVEGARMFANANFENLGEIETAGLFTWMYDASTEDASLVEPLSPVEVVPRPHQSIRS